MRGSFLPDSIQSGKHVLKRYYRKKYRYFASFIPVSFALFFQCAVLQCMCLSRPNPSMKRCFPLSKEFVKFITYTPLLRDLEQGKRQIVQSRGAKTLGERDRYMRL